MTVQEAFNLAVQRHQAGKLAEAQDIYRQILAAAPDHCDAMHLMGVAAHQSGQHSMAIDLINRAIAINGVSPDYYSNLGVILGAVGRYDDAVAAQRKAIALNPGYAGAYNNLGYILHEMDRVDEAVDASRQAVAIDPSAAGAHNNLGTALLSKGQLDGAIACFRYAIALQPGFPDAHNNLGKALYAKGMIDEAIECINRAISLKPDYPEAHSNLGNALCDKQQWQEAIACCRRSLALRPEYPAGHWNLAVMLLRQGDFENGWQEHEWRWRVKGLRQKITFPHPWWDGSALAGKRILIHAEQGLGDTIQFVRYVPEVARRGGKVVLAAQGELLRLLKQLEGVEELVSSSEPLPRFDVHCPLLSLPRVFKTNLGNVPGQVPYFWADAERARHWSERLNDPRKKIGLVWAGRAGHSNDRNRSFPAQTYAPLADIPGVWFISLQKGEAAGQTAPMEITDWTEELNDFADTAGLIANLDLIITADTAVAHLAGAMAKPVWVLLPCNADWRWMLDRSDSPWYPTMRLFRQPARGDWATPMGQVAQALGAL